MYISEAIPDTYHPSSCLTTANTVASNFGNNLTEHNIHGTVQLNLFISMITTAYQ